MTPKQALGVGVFLTAIGILTFLTVQGSRRMHDELTAELERREREELRL